MKILVLAGLAAAIFLGGVEWALLYPRIEGASIVRLGNGEIVAIASGMATSAGLVAIYFQFRQAREAAQKTAVDAAEHERLQQRDALLRADQLHAEWNLEAMHRHRDLAWLFFLFLEKNPGNLPLLGRGWVLDEGGPPIPAETHSSQKGIVDYSPYSWAISSIVAFFVRLEGHLQLHHSLDRPTDDELSVLLGPFFWNYWRPHLLALCTACEAAYVADQSEKPPKAKEFPYFITPIRRLANQSRNTGKPPSGWTRPSPDAAASDHGGVADQAEAQVA